MPGTSDTNESDSFKWNNDSIKLLLTVRLDMEKEFSSPTCKKKKLWEKVANKVNDMLGASRVTGESCDLKYRNLLGTYRVNKRKQNTTGEGAIKWEFFDIMDQVLGHKASSAPPKNLLGSTMEPADTNISSKNYKTDEEEESGLESDSSVTLPPKSKKKKVEELPLKQYLFLKLEKDKEKQIMKEIKDDRRWQEKKELKLKEIEAINNLAAAISSTEKRNFNAK